MAERLTDTDFLPFLQMFDRFSVRVKGDCMQPVIHDQAFAKIYRQKIYLPGDIVICRNGIGQLVCHRFLGYVLWRYEWKAMTRADNSLDADALIGLGCMLGKVIEVDQQAISVPLKTRVQALQHWLQTIYHRMKRGRYPLKCIFPGWPTLRTKP